MTSAGSYSATAAASDSDNSAVPDAGRRRLATFFGILGDFPGDSELLDEIKWCEHSYGPGGAAAVNADDEPPMSLDRLVSLLGGLPLKGRQALARRVLAKGPHRDAVLRGLFDYCLQSGGDDDSEGAEEENEDFVMIAYPPSRQTMESSEARAHKKPLLQGEEEGSTDRPAAPRPLNATRFHIFQTVLVLMPLSGQAGAEASRRYLDLTASTRHRAKVLIQAAACFSDSEFSDRELYRHYKVSPRSVQTRLVEACCQRRGNGNKKGSDGRNNSREEFLRLVYESDGGTGGSRQRRHPNVVYYLDSDYLASQLDALVEQGQQGDGSFALQHWGRHGDVYLNYIRRCMEGCRGDQLRLGDFWLRVVERSRCDPKSMRPRHVHALLNLLREYTVCRAASSLSPSAVRYLRDTSGRGDDVSRYDGICRIVMVPRDVLERLPQKDRLALARKYVEERDEERFRGVVSACPRHGLPYEQYFASISMEQFWMLQTNQVSDYDDFFLSMAVLEMLKSFPFGPQRSRYLLSWAALHDRYKPSDLSGGQISAWFKGQHTLESLWNVWFRSRTKFDHLNGVALRKLGEECDELAYHRPEIEAYAIFASDVLSMSIAAFDQVSAHLPRGVTLGPLHELLGTTRERRSLKKILSDLAKSPMESVKNLCELCIQFICDRMLPFLRDTMQFDPAAEATYVNDARLSFFERNIEAISQQWGLSDKVAAAVTLAVLDVHTRATSSLRNKREGDNFVVATDPPPRKKCRFAYYKFDIHARTKKACCDLAKTLLKLTAKVPSFDESLSRQLWALVRDAILLDNPNLTVYLHACNSFLPTHLRDEERPLIVERSTEFILSTYEKSPNSWKTALGSIPQELAELGYLSTVFGSETLSPKVTEHLQVEYGGFTNKQARQALKEEALAADADTRANGLIAWLTKACETGSSSLMAEAMSFAARRVKNESGIHRRTVFAWLESNFADKVVRGSLEDTSSAAKAHEKLCSAILDMQKNDLGRLDCVGRAVCFPRLPFGILETILAFDPTRLCREQRQLWVDAAIQMDWTLKAAMGEEELACYKWPIHRGELESASWISRKSFDAVYPAGSVSTAKKVARLRRRLGSKRLRNVLRNDFDKDSVFGPVQCVNMLESAIEKVWTDSLPSCALRFTGQLPEAQGVSVAWLKRIQTLCRLCGACWQEVSRLNEVFDSIFDTLGDATTKEHNLLLASNLLTTLCEIHKSSFWLVPKLAQACNKLFRCSVALGMVQLVNKWLPVWRMVYLEGGRAVPAQTPPVDHRLQHFVDLYAKGYEPDVWRPELSSGDYRLKKCCFARELLQMSPSALLLDFVRNVLSIWRQDVLLRYVRDPATLDGVFVAETSESLHYATGLRPPVKLLRCESIDELLYKWLNDEALLSCHADVSVAYARVTRNQASSSQLDLKSKVYSISKFMCTPSTQHADVLAALQSSLDDAVRESLISHMFKLDSPWRVLSHLLSQKAIEKNDQRITSSILRYVAQHVHIDKVVGVAGLLLGLPRRRKLSFQLHKGVICMLFDAKTPGAMNLLGDEWARDDVPDSVRSLIAEKCVHSVASGETQGWGVTVLTDIATNPSFQPELKFWLLAVQSPHASILSNIHEPVGVEKDEMLELFQTKGPSRVDLCSRAAMEKFRSILEEFQNSQPSPLDESGTLQLLAQLKKWELSPSLFMDPPHDDPAALDDMLALLSKAVSSLDENDLPDHPTQVSRTLCAQLFSQAVAIQLTHASKHKIKVKDQERSMALGELVEANDAARKFRAVMRAHLDAAIDMPARKCVSRQLVLHMTNTLVEGIKSYEPGFAMPSVLRENLVGKPFAKEWKLLRQDSEHVQTVLASSSATFASFGGICPPHHSGEGADY